MLTLVDDTPVYAQAIRRAICLPLPRYKFADLDMALAETIAQAFTKVLDVPAITPALNMLAPQQWMFSFYYGREKYTHASSYEKGQMDVVRYIPMQIVQVLFDRINGVLYLSTDATDAGYEAALLECLNETLFPARPKGMRWHAYRFNLNRLTELTPELREPEEKDAAWQDVSLKTLTWREVGNNIGSVRQTWVRDGFEVLESGEFLWPTHVQNAGLRFKPQDTSHYFSIELTHNDYHLRTSLTANKLQAIAALIKWCSNFGETILVEC